MKSSPSNNLKEAVFAVLFPKGFEVLYPETEQEESYPKINATVNLILDTILAKSEKLLERGFAVPKVGTPSHSKGQFTKLISSEELVAMLEGTRNAN